MINIGVLGSTKGTDLQAILDAIHSKKLSATVSTVISNRKNAYILDRAKDHSVPFYFISHKGKERKDFDDPSIINPISQKPFNWNEVN